MVLNNFYGDAGKMKIKILSLIALLTVFVFSFIACNGTQGIDNTRSSELSSLDMYNELSRIYNSASDKACISISDARGGVLIIEDDAAYILSSSGKEIWYGKTDREYFEATKSATYNGEPAIQTYEIISEDVFRSQLEYYKECALSPINEMMVNSISSDTFEGLKTEGAETLYQAKGSEMIGGIYTNKFFHQLTTDDGLPVSYSDLDEYSTINYSFDRSVELPSLSDYELTESLSLIGTNK